METYTQGIITQLTQADLAETLSQLKAGLFQILGDRLDRVYLYGSQARGNALPGSDIDVMIVIRGEFDYFAFLKQTSQLVADLSLKKGVVISRVFVSTRDFESRKTPLLMNVRREGILV